jgi:hypothetical protein
MTTGEILTTLHHHCHFQTIERGMGEASGSEFRRWCRDRAIFINGTAAGWDDQWDEITSLILFPRSARRKTTLR